MVFVPSLDYGMASEGFYDMVEMLVSDVYKVASLVKRLADHNGLEHYQVCVKLHEVLLIQDYLNAFRNQYL